MESLKRSGIGPPSIPDIGEVRATEEACVCTSCRGHKLFALATALERWPNMVLSNKLKEK